MGVISTHVYTGKENTQKTDTSTNKVVKPNYYDPTSTYINKEALLYQCQHYFDYSDNTWKTQDITAEDMFKPSPKAQLAAVEEAAKTQALEDFQNTLSSGGELKFTYNITNPEVVEINKNTTIDFNGKTLDVAVASSHGDSVQISNATVVMSNGVVNEAKDLGGKLGANIYVMANANVTLENMKVIGTYPLWVCDGGSTLTVKSGTYRATVSQAVYNASPNSKIIIEGGEFYAPDWNGSQYCLNLKDDIIAEGKKANDYIEVRGGTFINYNPSKSTSENPMVSFVADDCIVGSYKNNGQTVYIVKEKKSFGETIPDTTMENGKLVTWQKED